jgi:hypothetical protein
MAAFSRWESAACATESEMDLLFTVSVDVPLKQKDAVYFQIFGEIPKRREFGPRITSNHIAANAYSTFYRLSPAVN